MSILNPTFVDVIGLVGTGLTTIGFLQSNFPEKEAKGPSIVIKGMMTRVCSSLKDLTDPECTAGLPELTADADSLVGLRVRL